MIPPSSLRDRVLAAAASTPSRTRKQGERTATVFLALSVTIAFCTIELNGGFEHGAGRPLPITIAVAGGWVAASAFLTWLVARRQGSNLARRSTILAGAALLTPPLLFAWTRIFYGTYQEPFERVGYRCLAFTLVIAVTPLAAFLFLRRGIEPRRPMALGAMAGAVCGAWAGVVVDLWCPLTNAPHVLLGHIVPVALLIAGGALLGDRLLGVRRLPRR